MISNMAKALEMVMFSKKHDFVHEKNILLTNLMDESKSKSKMPEI